MGYTCGKNSCTLLVGSARMVDMVNCDLAADLQNAGLALLKEVTFLAQAATGGVNKEKITFSSGDSEFIIFRRGYFCFHCLSQRCLKAFNINF